MTEGIFYARNPLFDISFPIEPMDKDNILAHALAQRIRFENEMICFTLGGSLIPPKSQFEGGDTPGTADFVRQAVSLLGSPRVLWKDGIKVGMEWSFNRD